MNARRSLAVGGALVVSLVLGLFLGRPSAGQAEVPPPGGGRYQVVVVPRQGGNPAIYVFEPATGQCWNRDGDWANTKWYDLGSPAMGVKK
jgi:hypothetical protein